MCPQDSQLSTNEQPTKRAIPALPAFSAPLQSLSEHLCGCIFIEFEELREILNEREQSLLETVKQMKGLNQADMEEKLEHLKAYESAHSETISSIRAALEETNEFAFLKVSLGANNSFHENAKNSFNKKKQPLGRAGWGEVIQLGTMPQ